MSDVLTKSNRDAPPLFFEAEAAGLRWLSVARGARGARIVRVIDVAPGRIDLERVPSAHPTADAARHFGAFLAVTHDAGADAFGAPPDGWTGPLFIGRRPLPAAHERTWGVFYTRDRVLPYLELAVEAGGIGRPQASIVRQACDEISAGTFDDDEQPARIHGDLWHGNVLWSPDGVVLIDPAAHGGHRETDLAMLALFGCPYLDDIIAGYESVHPLHRGWRDRVPLHQLHPLAVHAASYGRGYGDALADAAARVIALADAT
jgi:fructosamine-3-kinase